MAVIANLEARYSANVISFEKELKRLQTINAKAADRIINDSKRAAKGANNAFANANLGGALQRSLGGGLNGLKADLAGLAASIAATISVSAAVGLADTYTRFSNSLRVAGLSGGNLANVQDRLFESATRNGVGVEALGQLYGRVSLAARELDVSQNDLLQVTDTVTDAIRVSGGTVASSSGAMMQLAQALGSGTVRAEEFNSILEGMPALANAAAAASSTYGGSVAKMRADVLAGKLSSKEFFDLILAGSAQLRSQAASAPLTVAQGFENLKTALIKYIGQTNEAWGITDRLGTALGYLANNLDKVASSLAIVAGVFAVTMAPAIGRAAIAMGTFAITTGASTLATVRAIPGMIGFSAALTGTSTAATAAAFGLRLLMSATGVGLAIVALTAVLGVFTAQNYKAAEATRQARDAVRSKEAALKSAREEADRARIQTGNLSAAETTALTATANLTGEVKLLATEYGRVALEAKRARLEILQTQLAEARANERTLNNAFEDRRRVERDRGAVSLSSGARSGIGADGRPLGNVMGDADTRARGSVEAQDFAAANRQRREAQRELDQARTAGAMTFAPPAVGATPPTGSGRSGGSSGPSAADRERNAEQALAQAQRELRDAVRAQAVTAEDRHRAALEALADDLAMAKSEIDRRVTDGQITAATADQLKAIEDQITAAQVAKVNADRAAEVELQRREVASLNLAAEQEAASIQEDALSYLAQTADTLEEKHRYEREALAIRQAADDRAFAVAQDLLALDLQKRGLLQAEIDRIIAANQANRDAAKNNESGQLAGDQRGEAGPQNIREWIDAFTRAEASGMSFNQRLFAIAEGGINSITDGLTDAIMGAKSFGEAFADMGRAVIAQLVRMLAQWAIFEALGLATGQGPGWGMKVLGMGMKSPGKNAMGTNNWGGGLSWVGEAGPELVNLQKGTGVIPNHEIRNAMRGGVGSRAQSQTFNLTTVVNANNAVMREDIRNEIAQAHIVAVHRAKQETMAGLANRDRNRLR